LVRYSGPARCGLVKVSYPNVLLFQPGCCIVMTLPLMLCTDTYRSVNELTLSIWMRFCAARLLR
jgi:hypothetical protein